MVIQCLADLQNVSERGGAPAGRSMHSAAQLERRRGRLDSQQPQQEPGASRPPGRGCQLAGTVRRRQDGSL